MRILDPEGRLFGRISVVDLLALLFLGCLAPLVPFGLRILRPLPPQITAVEPERVSSGGSVRVTGTRFKYGVQVLFADQPALRTEYYGSDLAIAHVPGDLAPGNHAVRVQNLSGEGSTWERTLEVVPPGPRPQVAVMITCAFTDLSPPEADALEGAALQQDGSPLEDSTRIVRIVKRGPMSSWTSGSLAPQRGPLPPGQAPKEFVIADVALLSEMAETPEGRRYFYQNQPLLFKLPVRLTVQDRPLTGTIHREPDPARPELERIRT